MFLKWISIMVEAEQPSGFTALVSVTSKMCN